VGHALVEQAMRATGAQLGGDLAGHYYFADRGHGHDDALYAAARLVQAIAAFPDAASAAAALAALPKAQAPAEIRIKADTGVAEELVQALATQGFGAGTLTQLDGDAALRVVWPDALCVARAATSTPGLALRFEGSTPDALRRAQGEFKTAFDAVRPGAALPF
jgi:phosphomannomutase/phosphoglucomutase